MGNRQLAWDDHSAVFAGNGRSAVLEPQSMRVVWTVDFSFLVFCFGFVLLWLILSGCQERRAGTQRQLPHVDGDSCEGLDRLPCHAIVAEHFGGSYSTRTVAEVGDGL